MSLTLFCRQINSPGLENRSAFIYSLTSVDPSLDWKLPSERPLRKHSLTTERFEKIYDATVLTHTPDRNGARTEEANDRIRESRGEEANALRRSPSWPHIKIKSPSVSIMRERGGWADGIVSERGPETGAVSFSTLSLRRELCLSSYLPLLRLSFTVFLFYSSLLFYFVLQGLQKKKIKSVWKCYGSFFLFTHLICS